MQECESGKPTQLEDYGELITLKLLTLARIRKTTICRLLRQSDATLPEPAAIAIMDAALDLPLARRERPLAVRHLYSQPNQSTVLPPSWQHR